MSIRNVIINKMDRRVILLIVFRLKIVQIFKDFVSLKRVIISMFN